LRPHLAVGLPFVVTRCISDIGGFCPELDHARATAHEIGGISMQPPRTGGAN
jgi:hypothetical protein